MILKYLTLLVFLVLFLTACAGTVTTEPMKETGISPNIAPTTSLPTSVPTSYPAPVFITPPPTISAYPGPGTPTPPPSGYEPQPGDAKLTRNPVFLEMGDSGLVVKRGNPVEVSAKLIGNMPSPCHELRVIVTKTNVSNSINLEVYTLVDPGVNCIMVLKPFEATIPLGSFSTGHYYVYVNEELLGEFDG